MSAHNHLLIFNSFLNVSYTLFLNLYEVAKVLLEHPEFDLEMRHKIMLNDKNIHATVRQAFLQNGHNLTDHARIIYASSFKWKINDQMNTYVIRDTGESLLVSLEKYPFLSSTLSGGLDISNNFYNLLKSNLFFLASVIRKRFIDKPDQTMVNIGAGKWYRKNWQVLDYIGDWYQYNKFFVDFNFDLTGGEKLPFADGSVSLFYSEHVFEHFSDDCCQHLFNEIYRSLKKEGGVRIVVPNADLLYERFGMRDEQFFEPWMSTHNTNLIGAFLSLFAHPRQPVDEVEVKNDFACMTKEQFFDKYSKTLSYDYERAGEHINWFNYNKLKRMLTESGFDQIFHSAPQKSLFEQMRGDGFDTRPHYSLHVDAKK